MIFFLFLLQLEAQAKTLRMDHLQMFNSVSCKSNSISKTSPPTQMRSTPPYLEPPPQPKPLPSLSISTGKIYLPVVTNLSPITRMGCVEIAIMRRAGPKWLLNVNILTAHFTLRGSAKIVI